MSIGLSQNNFPPKKINNSKYILTAIREREGETGRGTTQRVEKRERKRHSIHVTVIRTASPQLITAAAQLSQIYITSLASPAGSTSKRAPQSVLVVKIPIELISSPFYIDRYFFFFNSRLSFPSSTFFYFNIFYLPVFYIRNILKNRFLNKKLNYIEITN